MECSARAIVQGLPLERKAALCSGMDFWHTQGIEGQGVESLMMTDGPHGLRKQSSAADHLGLNESVPATCFPTASALASSWDRALVRSVGRALGEECIQEGVGVLLGPGINIKRSPLCGRNFEYYSEDPFLAGELAASFICGVQELGVGTSVKHFAVNNQETRRMVIDAVVDPRALHEIYLAPFEKAVRKGRPWCVMSAYNKVNGTYCGRNAFLLEDTLRGKWGFDGAVVSDWGAIDDRVRDLAAGLDLEMPYSYGYNTAVLIGAVRSGALEEARLDRAAERVVDLMLKAAKGKKPGFRFDGEAHHALARAAAAQSMVLLKNEGGILPLDKGRSIAVIGEFAKSPRYQGSGSSRVNPLKLENAFDNIREIAGRAVYAKGYGTAEDAPDLRLIREARDLAASADVAVVFAGLPDSHESEVFDRTHLRLPASHAALIEEVAGANPRTVVVLSNGAPVEMPWIGRVRAVLESYLGGEAAGGAVADILFGLVNPSGKLAETFPLRLEDTPCHAFFPSGPRTVEYRESIYVGYRYYDTASRDVLFPFGHGLSYTTFGYSDLALSSEGIDAEGILTVRVTVRNTGNLPGAEVVQLYVRDVQSSAYRPEKELKGFEKVHLEPGGEATVEFRLDGESFRYFDGGIGDWRVEAGRFEILVGSSSRDIRLRGVVTVESLPPSPPARDLRAEAPTYYRLLPGSLAVPDSEFRAVYGKELPPGNPDPGAPFTAGSTLEEVSGTKIGRKIYDQVMHGVERRYGGGNGDESNLELMKKLAGALPVRNLMMLSNGETGPAKVDALLLMMNGKPLQGLLRILRGKGMKKPRT